MRLAVLLLCAAGCSGPSMGGGDPAPPYSVPTMPAPMPGQASLTGRVLDGGGVPVAGATVAVAETDAVATTDDEGRYALVVPSDSTLTLATSAPGFAPSFRESIVLASEAVVEGFDLLLLPDAELGAMNALGAPEQAAAGGLVAVRLHATGPDCTVDGTHLSVWPPRAATVVYSRPGEAGALDQPDPTLGEVQADTRIGAWLAATLAPASMLAIGVDKPGCSLAPGVPSLGGVSFAGLRRIAPAALTEADLFLEEAAAP
jgi:Carboxypeptidase regulatory-like domain